MNNILNQPFKESVSKKRGIYRILLFGLFVFLFLYIFKPAPFGFQENRPYQFITCLGFGFLTSFVLFIIRFFIGSAYN